MTYAPHSVFQAELDYDYWIHLNGGPVATAHEVADQTYLKANLTPDEFLKWRTGEEKKLGSLSIGETLDAGLHGAGKGVGDVIDTAKAVPEFLGKLSDKNTWYRAGEAIIGGILLFGGLFIIAREIGMKVPDPLPARIVRKVGTKAVKGVKNAT